MNETEPLVFEKSDWLESCRRIGIPPAQAEETWARAQKLDQCFRENKNGLRAVNKRVC